VNKNSVFYRQVNKILAVNAFLLIVIDNRPNIKKRKAAELNNSSLTVCKCFQRAATPILTMLMPLTLFPY